MLPEPTPHPHNTNIPIGVEKMSCFGKNITFDSMDVVVFWWFKTIYKISMFLN